MLRIENNIEKQWIQAAKTNAIRCDQEILPTVDICLIDGHLFENLERISAEPVTEPKLKVLIGVPESDVLRWLSPERSDFE